MSQTLTLGPLVLPLALLLFFAAITLGAMAGQRAGRAAGVNVEPKLYAVLATGLIVARLAFVLRFSDAYVEAPWQVLDIRDGGWSPLAGLAAALLHAAVLAWRRPPLRKGLAAGVGAAAAVWLLGFAALTATAPATVRLPAVAMLAMDGTQVRLDQFAGRPTVVNLWATWCPPCRREMPVLLRAQQEHPDVHFVFANQGEAAPKVAAFLAAQQLPLRNVLLDARGDAGAALGHRALPTTLFFDARGRLVDTRVGELSRASLAERLQAISPSKDQNP